MTSYITSSNPYTLGFKPKSFFNARKNMLQKEIMSKEVNHKYYPKKDVSNFSNEEPRHYTKGLLELLPWTLTASVIFFALI